MTMGKGIKSLGGEWKGKTSEEEEKVFIATATGWCGCFKHPYTPIYSVTKSHGTPIIKGSIRRDSLNRKGFLLSIVFI